MTDIIYDIIINGDKALAWVGAALAGLIMRYVVQRIGNERVRAYMTRAATEVFTAVEEVWQTYVSALKASSADGKLSADEKAEAKARAIGIAKANIGTKGLLRLARVLGIDSLEDWLGNRVESSVNQLKIAGNARERAITAPLPLPPLP